MNFLRLVKVKNLSKNNSNKGFTMAELLVVLFIISLLGAIAVPNWLTFINTRHLNVAQNEVYHAMRQAQSQAIKQKLTWQASFRENNGVVQWTVHRAETVNFIPDAVKKNDKIWYGFHPSIRVYQDKNNKGNFETTLADETSPPMWRVMFNHQGCPIYKVGDECTKTSLRALGQITLHNPNIPQVQRCVYVSTVLGAMRMGEENKKANASGKYCY